MRLSFRFVLVVILLVVIAGAASFFISRNRLASTGNGRQIVFLTNGQVYFGTIKKSSASTIELHDVYYPSSPEALRPEAKRVTLQKLGDEVYSPENVLYINRDQVMYWENLRSESKINEAIKRFNEERQKASPSPSISPSPSATQ